MQALSPQAKQSLVVIRALAESYQAFERLSAAHIRQLGLTPSQFDIIATLGNTAGMTCKELGEKTLITKGTLTGVLDRLQKKQLIERQQCADKRAWHICLTDSGQRLFEAVFPQHVDYITTIFADYPAPELAALAQRFQHLAQKLQQQQAPQQEDGL